LSENSDYHAAKEKLALLQRRISELEELIEHVEIIKDKEKTNDSVI
jgi:transcription elongation GreA/GreB family factor